MKAISCFQAQDVLSEGWPDENIVSLKREKNSVLLNMNFFSFCRYKRESESGNESAVPVLLV